MPVFVVRKNGMLHSFIGTLDATGIRTFRSEDDSLMNGDRRRPVTQGIRFWAVLDSSELPEIHEALIHGQRRRAFEILVRQARAFGRMAG